MNGMWSRNNPHSIEVYTPVFEQQMLNRLANKTMSTEGRGV